MKTVEIGFWKLAHMLAAALLSGCAMIGSAPQSCKVLDPELALRYEGGCKDGLADGYGMAKGASVYQGWFKNGKKQGQGIKVWANGDRYEGSFKADKKDGLGSYRWGAKSQWAGDSYVGEYRNDKRHGQGVYEWANGDRYEGAWKEELRYGPSAMETQKKRALDVWTADVGKPGAMVCSELPQGLALREKVRGKVERMVGDQVEVRLTQLSDQPLVYAGKVVRSGQTISRAVFDWYLCD